MSAEPGLRGSPLVRMAGPARRPSRWWLAWLVALLIIHFITPLGTFIGTLVLGDPGPGDAWYPYVEAFTAAAVLLALFGWVRFKEGRPFFTVGFRPRWEWARPLVGFAIGAGLAALVVGLGLIAGLFRGGQPTHAFTGFDAILPILPLIGLQLLCSGGEQAISNGYMLQLGARQLPGWIAILGTSIIVGMQQTLNLVTLVNLVLLGAITALVALQQGSLWLVVGLQAGWYYAQDNIFGLPRGGVAEPAALLSIGPTPGTEAALSGGQFGIEAGLIATGVLVVAATVATLRLRRTKGVVAQHYPLEPSPTAAPA